MKEPRTRSPAPWGVFALLELTSRARIWSGCFLPPSHFALDAHYERSTPLDHELPTKSRESACSVVVIKE
jgi:hypothetical protein